MLKKNLIVILLFINILSIAQEICNNNLDDDLNGFSDSLDVSCNTCDSITQLNFEDALLPSNHDWVFTNSTGASSSSIINSGSNEELNVSIGNNFKWSYNLENICLERCDWSYDLDFNIVSESPFFCSCSWAIGVIVNSCLSVYISEQQGLHHYRIEHKNGSYLGYIDGVPAPLSYSGGSATPQIYFLFANNTLSGVAHVDNVSFFHCGNGCSCDTHIPVTACDSAFVNGNWYYSSQSIADTLTPNSGCGDSIVITDLTINTVIPTSLFAVSSPICEGENATIIYTGSGTSSGTYNWDFDGGTVVTGSGQGPYTINWATAGTKNITLIVDDGCISLPTTVTAIVTAPPTSTFTTSAPICKGNIATITYTGTASANANYFWDFDGGAIVSGNGQGPYTISWLSAGTHSVSLTVTENGCSSPLTTGQQVVEASPNANFDFSDICLGQAMNFIDLSSFTGGSISFWQWNFGDGTPSNNTQSPSYIYTGMGTYVVNLITTGNTGCNDTISKNVTVHPLPQALFETTNVCEGSFAQFNNLSSISGNDMIQQSLWNFGDGITVSNLNSSHIYAGTGTYSVQLLTLSNFGCSDSITLPITINPNPTIFFTGNPAAGCEPLCVSFQDSSIISSGSNAQWIWNIGDGSSVNNSQIFEHCYVNDSIFAANLYSVTLQVISDSGCASTLTQNNYITVYPLPNADFSVQPQTATVMNPEISVNDLSSGATNWLWNWGDNDTSSSQNPIPHQYADTGTYQITLIASSQFNCNDTAYQTVIIEPDFTFYIPNAFTPNDDGVNDTFTGKGVFIKEFEMMIFDRWGNLIYKTNSIDKPWDGKANNGKEPAQMDVYVYSIKVTDFKMGKHSYRGTVTIYK